MKNHESKYDGMADYYNMRFRFYQSRGKLITEAIKLAQKDVQKWLAEKTK